MPLLRDIAHITVTGSDLGADEVAGAAWHLWRSVRRDCDNKRLPQMISSEGVDGTRYDGSLIRHIISLWPEYTMWSSDTQFRFRGALYSYLKSTNNAHCLVASKKPVWWISANFSRVATEKVYAGSTPTAKAQRRAEEKLTPHEAGEDRAPAPVITRNDGKVKAPMAIMQEVGVPPARNSADSLRSTHEKSRRLRDERRDATLRIVSELKEPASSDEIHFALEKSGMKCDTSATRIDLQSLFDQGQVYRRVETREERATRAGGVMLKAKRARLYSTDNPVPARTMREVVDGYIMVAAPTGSPDRMTRHRIIAAVYRHIRRGPFTALDIAKESESAISTTRSRLATLVADGTLVIVKAPSNSDRNLRHFRVVKHKEDELRKQGRDALKRLGKKTEEVTPIEQNAHAILGVIADVGTSMSENELFLASRVDDRKAFNAALALLIAEKMIIRDHTNGVTFYGTEEPVISDPPPSQATAVIGELQRASALEDAFEVIRAAALNGSSEMSVRVAELESENADLKTQLSKAHAAIRALTEG